MVRTQLDRQKVPHLIEVYKKGDFNGLLWLRYPGAREATTAVTRLRSGVSKQNITIVRKLRISKRSVVSKQNIIAVRKISISKGQVPQLPQVPEVHL